MSVLKRYLFAKLSQRDTYIVTAIVGTLINVYGQLVVPFLRGAEQPLRFFIDELVHRPLLAAMSIALGYLFPFCVGVITAILTRYQNRWVELRSRFPDQKPDPVFRANEDGKIVDAGEKTRQILMALGIRNAQEIIGTAAWLQVLQAHRGETAKPSPIRVESTLLDQVFLLSHSTAREKEINIYLTRLPDRLDHGTVSSEFGQDRPFPLGEST